MLLFTVLSLSATAIYIGLQYVIYHTVLFTHNVFIHNIDTDINHILLQNFYVINLSLKVKNL